MPPGPDIPPRMPGSPPTPDLLGGAAVGQVLNLNGHSTELTALVINRIKNNQICVRSNAFSCGARNNAGDCELMFLLQEIINKCVGGSIVLGAES